MSLPCFVVWLVPTAALCFRLLTGETLFGCRIEVAVKQILSGLHIKTNASVANPESLEWFKSWANTT